MIFSSFPVIAIFFSFSSLEYDYMFFPAVDAVYEEQQQDSLTKRATSNHPTPCFAPPAPKEITKCGEKRKYSGYPLLGLC